MAPTAEASDRTRLLIPLVRVVRGSVGLLAPHVRVPERGELGLGEVGTSCPGQAVALESR